MSNGSMEMPDVPGLGSEEESDYPRVRLVEKTPIEMLAPESDHHTRVLEYLLKRIDESERTMQNFWPRWIENEQKLQAHIFLPDYEAKIKKKNAAGEPPKPVSIIIPTTQATVATIATYLTHTFTGRRPIHQVGAYRDEHLPNASNMETVIQYNHDHSRSIRYFAQASWDWQVYGFFGWRIGWHEEMRMRTKRTQQERFSVLGLPQPPIRQTERVLQKVYEGNVIVSIDPYGFLPDPRVPFCDVAQAGEYVFWRTWEGKHSLLRDEFDGHLKWVKYANPYSGQSQNDPNSIRNEMFGGRSFPGRYSGNLLRDNYMVDQGTIEIIPRELGLAEGTRPQKWMFTILNKNQIVQAESFDSDHGYHPVAISEPMVQTYGLGNPGTVDFISGLGDAISWLYNSHQANVHKVINNDLVVSPNMVVMKDLSTEKQGTSRIIRLKNTAIGQEAKNAIFQLPVQDVTKGHIGDINVLLSIIERISGASDNLTGVQDPGGRKTATEIRTAAAGAVNRLAYLTRIISAQAGVPMAEQMAMNNQQYLSDPFYVLVTGQQGIQAPIRMEPEMLVGDFHFPIHDGTLPLDRLALLDVWKEMFALVLQSPLAQVYDVRKMFERMSELGGIRNIESLRMQQMPDQQLQDQAQAGNAVPITPDILGALAGSRDGEMEGMMF